MKKKTFDDFKYQLISNKKSRMQVLYSFEFSTINLAMSNIWNNNVKNGNILLLLPPPSVQPYSFFLYNVITLCKYVCCLCVLCKVLSYLFCSPLRRLSTLPSLAHTFPTHTHTYFKFSFVEREAF